MKPSLLRTGAAVAAITLVLLPLRLPASLVASILKSESQGHLSLAASDGTIWHGSGQPLLDGQALAEQLRWDIDASKLLRGQLVYKIGLDQGGATLALARSGVNISEANLALAASPLFRLDERIRPYALTGQLRLNSQNMHIAKGAADGAISIEWNSAGTSLAPTMNPIGDYRVSAMPAGDGWQLQFSTLSGSLQINGNGNWQPNSGLNVDLGLKAAQGTEASLGTLLSRIGPSGPDGERRLKFNFR
jgi:general secretion pathway protein N